MNKRQYLKAIELLEKRVYGEFMDAIKARVNSASIKDIERGIVAQDIEKIFMAAGLTDAELNAVVESLRSAAIHAAIDNAKAIDIKFGVTHKPTQEWLAKSSAEFVKQINDSTLETIRAVVSDGYKHGRNPRVVATELIGKVDATGKRVGGVINLTRHQQTYVTNARIELATLNDAYFNRARRDKRFDAMVRKAIDTNTPLTDKQAAVIANAYSEGLIKMRAEAIARTEALRSISSGRHQAMVQAIEKGELHPDDVTRVWSSTMDKRTRDSHAWMNKQEVRHDEPFRTADGAAIMYPCDPAAPAAESIQCRCYEITRINHIQAQKRREGLL